MRDRYSDTLHTGSKNPQGKPIKTPNAKHPNLKKSQNSTEESWSLYGLEIFWHLDFWRLGFLALPISFRICAVGHLLDHRPFLHAD
jgi:hypothetical protein